jgi:hypothetical protein
VITKESLKEFVESSTLVTRRESTEYPGLFTLKYKREVFYKGLWNDYLTFCRGAVVDKDYNLVIRPMPKMFNYGIEKDAPTVTPDTTVQAVRKINGFMATLGIYQNQLIVSTTGSLDSDYVKMAREKIDKQININKLLPYLEAANSTISVEIVHENDPHIISEVPGVYYLRENYNDYASPNQLNNRWEFIDYGDHFKERGFFCPLRFKTTLEDLITKVKTVDHEGFVFYTVEGACSKLKSPYYLVNKFLARSKKEKVLNKSNIDEEFYPLIDAIECNPDYFSLSEQTKLDFLKEFYHDNYLVHK